MGFFSWLRSLMQPAKQHAAPSEPVGVPATTAATNAVPGAAASEATLDAPLPRNHWAVMLGTERRLRHFEVEALRYFEVRGETARVDDGVISVLPDTHHGLENIAKTCAGSDEADWRGLIAAHFDTLRRSGSSDPQIGSYESVRDRLVVRLWDQNVEAIRTIGPVSRDDVPGLKTLLSIDYPETVATVGRSKLEHWGVSDEELFAVAIENTLRLASRELEVQRQETTGLELIQGDSLYVSSFMLALDTLPGERSGYGEIVSVPSASALLRMPLTAAAIGHIHELVGITWGLYADSRGSTSRRVWWYFDGKFEEIECTVNDKQIAMKPGPGLLDAMERLAAEQS